MTLFLPVELTVPVPPPDAPARGHRFYRVQPAPDGPQLPLENFALIDQNDDAAPGDGLMSDDGSDMELDGRGCSTLILNDPLPGKYLVAVEHAPEAASGEIQAGPGALQVDLQGLLQHGDGFVGEGGLAVAGGGAHERRRAVVCGGAAT